MAFLIYLLSTVVIADSLIRSLETNHLPPVAVTADVIIVLGGGATLDTPDVGGAGHLGAHAVSRLVTGIQLQRQLNVPLLVAGGQVFAFSGAEAQIMRRVAVGLGVPPERIIAETESLNTEQNARNVKKILKENGLQSPILVTSAFHMSRAVWFFERQGVSVIPYPADYQVNQAGTFYWFQLLPNEGAFRNSCLALREYLGLLGAKALAYGQ
ncbi:MAG: YdcF family protein [Sporomusaceae bacterium]|nr:YdcF family protein [Sporomusaceae bacterium]